MKGERRPSKRNRGATSLRDWTGGSSGCSDLPRPHQGLVVELDALNCRHGRGADVHVVPVQRDGVSDEVHRLLVQPKVRVHLCHADLPQVHALPRVRPVEVVVLRALATQVLMPLAWPGL